MLLHETEIEARHPQATPRRLLDQTIGLEERHGLLHRLPRNTKSRGQLLLHEVSARQQRTIADFINDGLVDKLGPAGM